MRDERGLYERLSLEGFQSGLSWLTILRKREGFRAAFEGFDPDRVAPFGDRDVERLVADASIIRHRGKIEAAINNAGRAVELVDHGDDRRAVVIRCRFQCFIIFPPDYGLRAQGLAFGMKPIFQTTFLMF